MILANTSVCPVSSMQTAISTMFGLFLVRHYYNLNAHDQIVWYPTMCIILILYFAVPALSLFCASLLYKILKKTIMKHNSQIKSLIISQYLSGFVFMTCAGFIFTTEYFEQLPSYYRTYFFSDFKFNLLELWFL